MAWIASCKTDYQPIQTNFTMGNKIDYNSDYDQFFSDTRLTLNDMMPELLIFAVMWDELKCGKLTEDRLDEIVNRGYHMMTLPFLFKIRERLRKAGRWPEERNNENCVILSALMMVQAAKITGPDIEAMREALIREASELGIMQNWN